MKYSKDKLYLDFISIQDFQKFQYWVYIKTLIKSIIIFLSKSQN